MGWRTRSLADAIVKVAQEGDVVLTLGAGDITLTGTELTSAPRRAAMTDDQETTPTQRRPRWGRRIAAVALLAAIASPFWARPLLSSMEFFRVRRVEVRDARFTPPEEIRRRLKIDNHVLDLERPRAAGGESLPRIAGEWRQYLAEVPVDARGDGRGASTSALVQGKNGLQAYDAEGRGLPLDPSRTPVDVPLMSRADTALLRFLGQLQVVQRDLFARVNEIRRNGRDELVLDLVNVSVRVRPDISVERLAQVSSVESYLADRQAHARELDFRFRDQVIARFQ
jgi:cell division protein FtsQ